VHDYIYRPTELKDMNLYRWVLQCKRRKYKLTHSKNGYNPEPSDAMEFIDVNLPEDIKKIKITNNNSDTIMNNDSNSSDDEKTDHSNTDNETLADSADLSDPDNIEEDSIPNNLSKNMYRFQNKHPLYETHVAILKPLQCTEVVNFIGHILPRCDQGDREYYCLTMLALFKPWRTGFDLKTKTKSWDEAFNEHNFTKREKQLMRNFNIKYECFDARDDFRVQMKAGTIPNEWLTNCTNNICEDEEFNFDHDPYVDPTDDDPFKEPDNQKLCISELKRQKEALEIRNVLQRTGWLDETPEITPYSNPCHVTHTSYLPPASWKAMLQEKKQDVLQNKVRAKSKPKDAPFQSFTPNVVKIIDKAYLEKKFHTTNHNIMIGSISQQYCLNDEQDRAFKIVANHVVLPNSEPLKMYIGGMGGTGKSQVIKAISNFFEQRNEAYRFIIVAPTGTAAALLSGSTYHSVFGINDMSSESQATKTLMQVQTRLLEVDDIFMDEVSMLSCHDMYKISAQLCKVMNEPTKPFGGLNMLFAGDFAQLPPPVGSESVALYSRTVGQSGTWKKAQEMAIGRALWHLVNTVVILRQNMRQTTQSKDDDKLRMALENMRYKDCNLADIQFLRSCITSQLPGKPSITNPDFKFVSIITAKNAQKDEINKLGCQLFAQHTGQKLIEFYSEDSLKPSGDIENTRKLEK
jgi:hypothetical protein